MSKFKFMVERKNINFSYLNNDNRFIRTASIGGMTIPTAIPLCNNLNRFLTWVDLNPALGEDPNDRDIDYICMKIMNLSKNLHTEKINSVVAQLVLMQEVDSAIAAKKNYFTVQLDDFSKDRRVLKIIDNYISHNIVDNMEVSNKSNKAELSSYELYTMCIMFMYSKIYYIAYLTVMDSGKYFDMVSPSLFGFGDNKGLLDVVFDYTIATHYPANIGLLGGSFLDRLITKFIGPYVDSKVNTSKLLDKFSVMGVNSFSVYKEVCTEIFSGLHRVFPAIVVKSDDVEEEHKDTFKDGDNPSDRKYFLLKVTGYMTNTLRSVMDNCIGNIKPKFSVRVESADDSAEKDVFDASINENKEGYKYIQNLKKSIFVDALSRIDKGTLVLFENTQITRHGLNKFILSIYCDIKYNTSEPINYLTYEEYKVMLMHAFTLMGDYPELRMAIMGKIYTRINGVDIRINDFGGDIPPYLSNNINKGIKILNGYIKSQYRCDITVEGVKQGSVHSIKDDLIRFLKNMHTVFGKGV